MSRLLTDEELLKYGKAPSPVEDKRVLSPEQLQMYGKQNDVPDPYSQELKTAAQREAENMSAFEAMGRGANYGIKDWYHGTNQLFYSGVPGFEDGAKLADTNKAIEANNADFAPISEEHPIASTIGQGLPLALTLPTGSVPAMMTGAGIYESMRPGTATERARRGAMSAIATGALPIAGSMLVTGAGKVAGKITPKLDEATKRLVDIANKRGLPLDVGQSTNTPSITKVGEYTKNLPIVGTNQAKQEELQAEKWQELLFTEGGQNRPWSIRSPITYEPIDKPPSSPTSFARPKLDAPEGTPKLEAPKRSLKKAEQDPIENVLAKYSPPEGQYIPKTDKEWEDLGGVVERDPIDGQIARIHFQPTPSKVADQETLSAWDKRIGLQYQDVNSHNFLPVTKEFKREIGKIRTAYRLDKMVKEKGGVSDYFEDVQNIPTGWQMPGNVYQSMVSQIRTQAGTMKRSDEISHRALEDLRKTMKKHYVDHMKKVNPEDFAAYEKLDRDNAIFEMVKDAADTATTRVDPNKLFKGVVDRDTRKGHVVKLGRGDQAMKELADLGRAYVRPPPTKSDSALQYFKNAGISSAAMLPAALAGGLAGHSAGVPIAAGVAAGTAAELAIARHIQNILWKPRGKLNRLVFDEIPDKYGKAIKSTSTLPGYVFQRRAENGR